MTLYIFSTGEKPMTYMGFSDIEWGRTKAKERAISPDDLYVIQDETYAVIDHGIVRDLVSQENSTKQ